MGIVLHSTRGSAQPGTEFDATLNWFASPTSKLSAHVVIGVDGRRARVVPDELMAWHAGYLNAEWLGVELEQPHIGDPISDVQYQALQEWIDEMRSKYGPLQLVEHKDTDQGKAAGKSDIGAPFDVGRLVV